MDRRVSRISFGRRCETPVVYGRGCASRRRSFWAGGMRYCAGRSLCAGRPVHWLVVHGKITRCVTAADAMHVAWTEFSDDGCPSGVVSLGPFPLEMGTKKAQPREVAPFWKCSWDLEYVHKAMGLVEGNRAVLECEECPVTTHSHVLACVSLEPHWRTRMLPARTVCPPNFFTPRRWE